MHSFTELLLFLPSLCEFWTKVQSKCKESYLKETKDYELNINKFHAHGTNTVFYDAVKGDGETFYCHCAKHVVPRITKETLKKLGRGVGTWTMQGLEY